MFDLIIKFLGGYTKHEWELEQVTLDSWRTRAIAAETTVTLFSEIMTRERTEKKQEEAPILPPNLKPLGDRRVSSWPRIKRELERQNMVKQDAQVSREEIEKTVREG